MKVTLLKTVKTVQNRIKQFTTNSKAIDKAAHQLLLSTLNLSAPANGGNAGNLTLLASLLNGFPASGRRNAAIEWINVHTDNALSIFIDKKTKQVRVKVSNKAKGTDWSFDVESAMEVPFWVLRPEPAVRHTTFRAMLQSTINSARRAMEGKGNTRLDDDTEAVERALAGIQEVVENTLTA